MGKVLELEAGSDDLAEAAAATAAEVTRNFEMEVLSDQCVHGWKHCPGTTVVVFKPKMCSLTVFFLHILTHVRQYLHHRTSTQ